MPGAGWNYGHDGAVDWARKLRQSFGDLSFTIDNPIEAGGCVVTHGVPRGRASAAGRRWPWVATASSTSAGGKVRRVEFFESRRGATEAALARRR